MLAAAAPARLPLAMVAAAIAGIVNSIAGGGTLLTFPALLALGVSPEIANATSTVARLPGALAGARRDRVIHRQWRGDAPRPA